MYQAIYLCDSDIFEQVYGPDERAQIEQLIDIIAPQQTAEMILADPALLADVDIIMASWGMPPLDESLLAAAPKLWAVFYAAGSIRSFMTDAAWDRSIVVSSAYAANAIPVIEFTFAQILLSLKRVWYYALETKRLGEYPPSTPLPGGFGSTVGLVSLGEIGRGVAERLMTTDIRIIAYDPFVDEADAARLGVRLCSLPEVFEQADVVSLHTPWLPETEGLISGQLIASMKANATLINTSRGAIVQEEAMISVLRQRPDLYAVLDVTYPEPPASESPLYSLPNVVLTPHIAGSMDGERRRMARFMIEELQRYLRGEPLRWAISRAQAARMA